MSLGFDAIGRLAIGQLPSPALTPVIMVVASASFAVTTKAVSFKVTDNISPASFVVAAQGVTAAELEKVTATSFAVTAQTLSFRLLDPIASASFTWTPNPVLEPEVEPISPTSFVITPTDVTLKWTGASFDLVYGGVGHYKVEMERARQLARITRKTPPPIDRRSVATFSPVGGPPSAPIAPAIDLKAIQNQRMVAQAQAVKVAQQRRDEEALLLLAS